MQSILREKLMTHALKLAGVNTIYRTESHRFVDAYFLWLQEAEKDLSALRMPISILLQAEKSTLTSVLDGYQPADIQAGTSTRKIQRAVAARSLEKVAQEFYTKVKAIDQELDQWNEKLCHAVAVLASKDPSAFENIQANQLGADAIWKLLAKTPETIPIYHYFSAKITATDRNYLLIDILQKMVSNRTSPP